MLETRAGGTPAETLEAGPDILAPARVLREEPDALSAARGYEEVLDVLPIIGRQLAALHSAEEKTAASLPAETPRGTVGTLPTTSTPEVPLDALLAGGADQCPTDITAGTDHLPRSPR